VKSEYVPKTTIVFSVVMNALTSGFSPTGTIPLYMPVAFRISSDRSDHDPLRPMYNKSVFRSFLLRLLRLNCICSRNQNISRVVFVYGGDVGIVKWFRRGV
jgi:hypothetical protein